MTLAQARALSITGTTRLLAVVGDPIAQVQAPSLVNPLLAELGRDAVVVPVHARAAEFPTVLAGLRATVNLDGVLVTIPHKAAAASLADRRSPAVEITGAANVLRREPDGAWRAENFDGVGFTRALARAGDTLPGARVSLVGGGGAGSAIAAALLDAGIARLHIHDPDGPRLAALLARLEIRWPGRAAAAPAPVTAGIEIIVNATPLGLRPGDPLPFPVDDLPDGCAVADIIMKPPVTALLRAAAERGLPTRPGRPMLAEQVELYREFFRLDDLPALDAS